MEDFSTLLKEKKDTSCSSSIKNNVYNKVLRHDDLMTKKRQRSIIDFFGKKSGSSEIIDASLGSAEVTSKQKLSDNFCKISSKENLRNEQNSTEMHQNINNDKTSNEKSSTFYMKNETDDAKQVLNIKTVLLSSEKKEVNEEKTLEDEDEEVWKSALGCTWYLALKNELKKPYFKKCIQTVNLLRKTKIIYPPEHMIFNAFKLTPLDKVKVVIVGQDPYHQPGQAMGLCFSVPRGITPPPSLKNMFKEIGIESMHGDLSSWAQQGVFMINSLLSVVKGCPMAHKDLGWSIFTDRVIDLINEKCEGVVFFLWGRPAQKKSSRVDKRKHYILEAGHPSPLSFRHFQGCGHFKKCNELLKKMGKSEIIWTLPS